MSQPAHSYGSNCYLSRCVSFAGSKGHDDIPTLKAQFFYLSPNSIDDPLSGAPDTSKSAKATLRPFLPHDSHALEETWLSLSKHHKKAQSSAAKKEPETEQPKVTGNVNSLGEGNKKKERNKPAGNVDTSPSKPLQEGDKKELKQNQPKQSLKEAETTSKTRIAKTMQGSLLVGDTTIFGSLNMSTEVDKVTTKEPVNPDTNYPQTEVVKTGKVTSKSPSTTKAKSRSPSPKSVDGGKPVSNKSMSSSQRDIPKNAIKISKSLATAKSHKKDDASKAADSPIERGTKQYGNPYDSNCENPQRTSLDSDLPSCCQDLERDTRTTEYKKGLQSPLDPEGQLKDPKTGQDKSKGKQDRSKGHDKPKVQQDKPKDKQSSGTSKLAEAQGDAASDARSVKQKDKSQVDKAGNHQKSPAIELQPGKEKLKRGKSPSPDSSDRSKSARKSENIEPADKPASTASGAAGTTGLPFLKLPSRISDSEGKLRSKSQLSPMDNTEDRKSHGHLNRSDNTSSHLTNSESTSPNPETFNEYRCKKHKSTEDHVDVAVGVSRLHQVELPALQMKPIYWSPVHDIAAVTRGTWFYKDTMFPVEPAVANQLEMGYREVRAWSTTWSDQLNSAVEVGAHAEEKIVHQLWAKEDPRNSKIFKPEDLISSDPYCAAKHFYGEAAAEGTADASSPDEKLPPTKSAHKKYLNWQVIYKDAQNAFLLKPTLQPSAYYSRRPLNKIKKGFTIGTHVVRGFDWKNWEKLHHSKKHATAIKAEPETPASGDDAVGKKNQCSACKAQDTRPIVTELILVIHGIGQKLSERVESFHFTHAISGLRSSVNCQLQALGAKGVLREDMGGVMVLPVNWRSKLSFEEGGPLKERDQSHPDFSLKDITLESIPAVRSLISDVMLDIPYYMSQHRPKMIQAVISEANRVYRLWCKHNPDFQKDSRGRVHIIAHSLGSAIALDVLSRQPTVMPSVLDKKINTKCFDFNTTNLFFVGSPAGFFLLLEKAKLVPRNSKNKPGADWGDGHDLSIASLPEFGCLAVDNIYNIMHENDPVAYRLNATVDPQYAACLKSAHVPSATSGFLGSIQNVIRTITPGAAAPTDPASGQITKPPGVARLPSQLEMEEHDFSREEIAEKRFYLLNDNGQVDWILSSGGGPFEVVYINMLSAHSSYWESNDFIRMIVTEVGRRPGKDFALPIFKAAKIGPKV